MKDWQTYQDAYKTADQKIKDVLHSSLIPECVAENVSKYELDTSHQKVLVALFSEKTLGLIDETKLIEEMRQAGIPAAKVICADILKCLNTNKPSVADTSLVTEELSETKTAPINTPESKPTTPVEKKTVNTPENDVAASKNSLASEIAETQAALESIPKMRTMAQDAQDSTTHSTSQSDLLNTKNRWSAED